MDSPPPSNFTIPCQSVVRPRDAQNQQTVRRSSRAASRRSSRVYPPDFQYQKPRLVTGTNTPIDQIEKTSQIYKTTDQKNYFDQCFKIIRRLGKGVFGEADEVESLEDGKHYAVKRALRTFESASSRRMKIREVLVHESVPHHENILRFEKAWEERGRLYIQTELCGGNLSAYRRQYGILTENELYLVFVNMVKALHHLHSISIIHLDIKPSNILIYENSICKLGDFGLAYNLNENSTGCGEEGDKYYLAPEILNNPPTTAADIFSLGVTMLELATNVDLDKDRELILNGEISSEWFGDLSDDLTHLIRSMLILDPIQRPTAGMLLDDLVKNPRPPVIFKEVENTSGDLPSAIEDPDWDFDIAGTWYLTRELELTQIQNFSARLEFDDDDEPECSAARKTKKENDDNNNNNDNNDNNNNSNNNNNHEVYVFSRRLTFSNPETDEKDHEPKPLKRRRLFD